MCLFRLFVMTGSNSTQLPRRVPLVKLALVLLQLLFVGERLMGLLSVIAK